MTTAYYSTIANTFGHVAYDGDARINDALGTILEQAPNGALARFRFKRAHNRPDRAQLHLGRAWQRLTAMSEALIAREGARLSQEFAHAYRGAGLLIGADLVTAQLIDPSDRTKKQALHILTVLMPQHGLDGLLGECVFECVGNRHEIDALQAVTTRTIERDVPLIAAWHSRRSKALVEATETRGFLADVAFVRNTFYASYDDVDFDLPEAVSKRALIASRWAIAIGHALGAQTFSAHRAPVLA